jgi:hypothetical protein
MISMSSPTEIEIITDLIFVATGVGAIIYGLDGWQKYSKRELWWSVMGALTISVAIASYVTRYILMLDGEIELLVWGRRGAMLLLAAGWVLLAYKMGYFGNFSKLPQD